MTSPTRVALVTGASRGIGSATARVLAEANTAVALHHEPSPVMRDLANATANDLTNAGHTAATFATDLTDADATRQLIEDVFDTFGQIDIAVLNAAYSERRPVEDITLDSWDRAFDVNVRSMFVASQTLIPHLRQSRAGRIITIGSVMFDIGSAQCAHYVATKGAVVGLTRVLATELGPDNITVNCVVPGGIRTEGEQARLPDGDPADEAQQRLSKLQAIPRRGTSHDVAACIAFLADTSSGFITGQVLRVDGGWVMT